MWEIRITGVIKFQALRDFEFWTQLRWRALPKKCLLKLDSNCTNCIPVRWQWQYQWKKYVSKRNLAPLFVDNAGRTGPEQIECKAKFFLNIGTWNMFSYCGCFNLQTVISLLTWIETSIKRSFLFDDYKTFWVCYIEGLEMQGQIN